LDLVESMNRLRTLGVQEIPEYLPAETQTLWRATGAKDKRGGEYNRNQAGSNQGASADLPREFGEGDLLPGLYRATLPDVLERFGQGSVQRRAVAARLSRLHQLAVSTGQLARFVVFGSFVTAKADPNDVDVVLLMEDAFDLAAVTGEAALVFQHLEADSHFGASVFWTNRSGALAGEQAMIEYWQVRREGGQRGIVEIVGEGS
jgi:predicted nucleotidyltransferase